LSRSCSAPGIHDACSRWKFHPNRCNIWICLKLGKLQIWWMIFIFPHVRAIWGDIAFSDTISGEQIDHNSCGEPQNSQGKFQGKIYNNQTQQIYIYTDTY
jgi:hypothetical protein